MAYESVKLRPPIWARSGHVQTILGHFLRIAREIPGGECIELALPDGDALAARLYTGTSSTVVYLFHGLGGSTDAGYIRRLARRCLEQGHSVLLVNHRGCGEGRRLQHVKPYHSGSAEDLSAALDFGRKRFEGKKHIAVGFSLSGNALLLLLTGRRGSTKPDAAIAVNAPIELAHAADRLSQGFNRVYDIKFVQECSRDLRFKRKQGWLREDVRIPRGATLKDFDEIYTAPHAGFRNREHYYSTCSSGPGLKDIRVPTIILTAKDDPFVPVEDYERAEVSPAVKLKIASNGGHMGYLERGALPFVPRFWLDDQLVKWIGELGAET